jgi:hypothetical protein
MTTKPVKVAKPLGFSDIMKKTLKWVQPRDLRPVALKSLSRNKQKTKIICTTVTTPLPGAKPNTMPTSHTVVIQANDPKYEGKLSDCKNIKVNCTCGLFKFYYEWVLWRKGSADLTVSNEPPRTRNPRLRVSGCHHTLASQLYIQRKGY